MSKTSPLIYVVLAVISILLMTCSMKAVSDVGFTSEDGGETVVATYQSPVCRTTNPRCAEPDIWQITILWQDGVQINVFYEKIVDSGEGSTLQDAQPVILSTTTARACMRNLLYCPKNNKP